MEGFCGISFCALTTNIWQNVHKFLKIIAVPVKCVYEVVAWSFYRAIYVQLVYIARAIYKKNK